MTERTCANRASRRSTGLHPYAGRVAFPRVGVFAAGRFRCQSHSVAPRAVRPLRAANYIRRVFGRAATRLRHAYRPRDGHAPTFHPLARWRLRCSRASAVRRRSYARAARRARSSSLGFHTVYLFTPSAEHFFSRLGWSVVEHTLYRNTDVTIMSHTEVDGANGGPPYASLLR